MHESNHEEPVRSSPAGLIFANLGYVCSMVAVIAGFAMLFWYAEKGEGSDMIGNSAIAGFGVLVVCVPLVGLGVLFSVIGISLPGHRGMAAGALCLSLMVPVFLWKGMARAAKTGLERSIARQTGSGSGPSSMENTSRPGFPAAAAPAHVAGVSGVAFSPDGTRLVTLGSGKIGDYAHEVKVWETTTGKLLESKTLLDGQHEMLPGGRVWASKGHSNTLVNGLTGERSGPFRRLPGFGRTVDVLSGTNILVYRPDAKSIVLWNLELGTEIASFTDWEGLAAVTIAPDAKRICIHQPRKRKLAVVDGHTGRAEELPAQTFSSGKGLFSADGTLFAVGGIQSPADIPQEKMNRLGGRWQSGISIVQIFDLAAKTNAVLYLDGSLRQGQLVPLAFSADKRRLIAKDEWSLVIYDLERWTTIAHITKKHYNSAASPDGNYIATIPEGNAVLETWDGRAGKQLGTVRLPGFKNGLYKLFGFGPNSTSIAIWQGGTSVYVHDVTSTNQPVILTDPATTSLAAKR